jgi:2-polyprenyl-3-methyl-5-hydroxy-6-metoxy-1,4-benzoquinol methylase
MKWHLIKRTAWIDTRAKFVNGAVRGGSLLDLGSSDGETLSHIHELRPDLRLHAVDLNGSPEKYPERCEFVRSDLEYDRLPWNDASMDAITCMHVVEHLNDLKNLFREISRLLKPGTRAYIETPHPKSMFLPSPKGEALGRYTLNFFDDLTHIRPVTLGVLAQHARAADLHVPKAGVSRNWLFAAAYPVLRFSRPSRKRYTAQGHWMGWSNYLVAERMS